jgi:hypothetical protein
VAGRQELVRRGRRPLGVAEEVAGHEHPHEVLRGLVGAGHERDVGPEHDLHDPGQQRVVRAAEHHRVDPRLLQRREVRLRDAQDLPPARHAALDEVHEAGARRRRDLDVARRAEHVLVGARRDGGAGADHADVPGAGGGHRPAHRGQDDLDDRHRVALPDVDEAGRGRAVARHHERLDPAVHERVAQREGVAADLGDGQRAVRAVRGVAHVHDAFGGQLVDDGPRDGEPADPGVEDPDGCVEVGHGWKPRPCPVSRGRWAS